MKSFARFTAVAFIILGLALMIGGWIMFAADWSQGVRTSDGQPPMLFEPLDIGSRVFAVILMLTSLPYLAFGQGLYLIAEIAEDTHDVRRRIVSLGVDSSQNRDFLAALVHRINPPKP
jgi:hypothetical protein